MLTFDQESFEYQLEDSLRILAGAESGECCCSQCAGEIDSQLDSIQRDIDELVGSRPTDTMIGVLRALKLAIIEADGCDDIKPLELQMEVLELRQLLRNHLFPSPIAEGAQRRLDEIVAEWPEFRNL